MEPSTTTEPGTLLKGRWQWQSNPNPWDKKETPRWESYPLEHDYLIEKAYYEKKHEVDIGDHIVSIKHMIQKKKGSVVSQRSIRRIDWIDVVYENDRSQRYFDTEPPQTINKVFGSLEDFLRFFSRRNQEILKFTKDFQDLETSNDMDILHQKIVPKLIDCFEEMLLKPNEEQLKDSSLSYFKKKLLLKIKERIEEMISLLKKESLSLEEFYGRILRAYTMDTDLYPLLNNYLRNENWVQVDKLLPYAFCLCKAFFNLSLQKGSARDNGTHSSMFLYRGTAFDESSLSFYNTKQVQYFSWNSVTSTSKDNKIAEEFMYKNADLANKKYPVTFVIEVPLETEFESEYLKWIDIHQYSAIPKEDEVIFPPGSVFELQEIVTDQNKITMIKIKLRNEIKSLAHGGMMMQGTLQSQLMTEKEAKIMCLQGEELDQALVSLKGNKLIEELELCLCTFDKKLLRKMLDILPTLERGKRLKFIECSSNDDEEITDEGSIEGERCEITKLEVIGASNFLKVICNEKWNQKYWVALRELDLDFQKRPSLKDEEELDNEVSQWLKYLPQLKFLNINFKNCYDITDDGVKCLAGSLNFLTQLTSLNLNFETCSSITDHCVNSLAHSLNYLTNFAHLNMNFKECKQITNEAANSLAQSLNSLTKLAHLNMNFKYCEKITDNGVNTLASQGFKFLSQLKSLNLSFSVLENARLLPQGIGYLTQLTSLTLDTLYYDDEELNSFVCDGLKYLLQLKSLTLPFQGKTVKGITDKGLEVFAFQGLKPLLFLTSLDLSFCYSGQITDKGVESLASQGLQHLIELKSFVLKFSHCNQITDEGVRSLMTQGLKNLTQLTSLTLNFPFCYHVTEEGIETLTSKWLRKLPVFDFLVFQSWRLYTIDIQTQLRNSRRLKLAREIFQKDKQFLDEQFSGFPTENCNLKIIPNSSKSLKQSEKTNSKDLLDKLVSIFKKNEDIMHDPQSTLKTLEIFPEIRHLISLNLNFKNYYSNKTDKFVHNLASQVLRHSAQLRFLTLKLDDSGITDKGVGDLAFYGLKSLTALASLTLDFSSYSSSRLTDKGVRDLALHGLKYLVNLASLNLNLSKCTEITDRGMMNLADEGLRHISQLKSLTLKFNLCDELTNEGWTHLAWNGLRHLSQLKSLVLKPCRETTDKEVDSLVCQGFKYLTQLKSLSLDFSWSKITDKGVNNLILQVVKKIPQLTLLDLNFLNTDISNFTIQNIIKVLHYFGFTKEINKSTKSDGYEIEETDEDEILVGDENGKSDEI